MIWVVQYRFSISCRNTNGEVHHIISCGMECAASQWIWMHAHREARSRRQVHMRESLFPKDPREPYNSQNTQEGQHVYLCLCTLLPERETTQQPTRHCVCVRRGGGDSTSRTLKPVSLVLGGKSCCECVIINAIDERKREDWNHHRMIIYHHLCYIMFFSLKLLLWRWHD